MPKKQDEALVESRVLIWARESMGLTVRAVASRLGVPTNTVDAWESGSARPNVRTLREIARVYKRPSALFFFPEPPQEPALPGDFRAPSVRDRAPLTEKTRLAIRRARREQALALELAQNLNRPFRSAFQRASLSDSPETLAEETRKLLAISPESQLSWANEDGALEYWKAAVERQGVLVLRVGLPPNEASGLSLTGDGVPAILVNAREPIVRQIFTLFHEYSHLMLAKGGICEISHSEDWASGPIMTAGRRVEQFCNHFAGALLVPKESLLAESQLPSGSRSVLDEDLKRLGNKFKVSQEVILRRLAFFNIVSIEYYQKKRDEWIARAKPPQRFRSPTAAGRCVREKGVPFVSLVLENRRTGRITGKEVADYLETRSNHLPRIEEIVAARSG
jgi:Zn-dependent peptidase ImmA (M78 family)/transcriptional regulator with XRE-family HTH domain